MIDGPTAAAPPPQTTRRRLPPWAPPAALFAFLMAAYFINGAMLPVRDAAPNVCLAVEALKHGSMSFTPLEEPFMFSWTFQGRARTRKSWVGSWDRVLEGRKARELLPAGVLSNPEPRYY